MARPRDRAELEDNIGNYLSREMSARTIMFHQAVADFAGVTVTDMKCMDYIDRGGDVTAGDLARLTGLTTGAITAAIDRLEKAGYAVRERSEVDRRKVFIRFAKSPKVARMHPIYDSLHQEMGRVIGKYTTRELESIQDFMLCCIKVLREHTETVTHMKSK